uniref:EGF-like domain-containing protein n=1 Tax=Macrostomum lignano TaxID=282301 RepID=A0A1I8HF91_9PLAT
LTFDPCAAASAVCQNGGVCEIVGANRTRCICPPGTAGLRCEIDYINSCKSSASPTGESPCHGDQSECRDLPEGFRCRCQPGLCGPTCDRECPTFEEERSSLACDWDGGDCASGWQPWANCTAARSGDAGGCIAGYGDGLCQLECSDQRCLFDGGDCDASTSAPSDHEYESYCRDHFADGRCDSGCDTAAYLFD